MKFKYNNQILNKDLEIYGYKPKLIQNKVYDFGVLITDKGWVYTFRDENGNKFGISKFMLNYYFE